MKVYLVSEKDDDPYAGVHPQKAFADEKECEDWIDSQDYPANYTVQEMEVKE